MLKKKKLLFCVFLNKFISEISVACCLDGAKYPCYDWDQFISSAGFVEYFKSLIFYYLVFVFMVFGKYIWLFIHQFLMIIWFGNKWMRCPPSAPSRRFCGGSWLIIVILSFGFWVLRLCVLSNMLSDVVRLHTFLYLTSSFIYIIVLLFWTWKGINRYYITVTLN